MDKINFSSIAGRYKEASLVQKSASQILFSLLDLKPRETVLDLGCGTGNLTLQIKKITNGKVVGIDVAEGMIKEAVNNYSDKGIEFNVSSVDQMNFKEEFDAIFCNSTFQWFKNPDIALKNIFSALKPGGRIGIQAPGTDDYCPNFVSAINKLTKDERTSETFSYFHNPWLFLNSTGEYEELFRGAGFKVAFAKIESVTSQYSPAQVFEVFSSGAIAGYLNQDNYTTRIDEHYIEFFKNVVKEEIDNQKNKEGLVNLIFNRIYLVALKPN